MKLVENAFPGIEIEEDQVDEYDSEWQAIQELENQKKELDLKINKLYFEFTQKWWK